MWESEIGGMMEVHFDFMGVETHAQLMDSGKLRSAEYTAAILEEANFWDDAIDLIMEVYTRLGRFPLPLKNEDGSLMKNADGSPMGYEGQKRVIFMTNYFEQSNALYKKVYVPRLKTVSIFEYPPPVKAIYDTDGSIIDLYSNPDADYVNKVPAGADYWIKTAKKELEFSKIDVLEKDFLGQFTTLNGGLGVYKNEFKPEIHLTKDIVIGYDHTGFNQAMCFMQSGASGYIVIDEIVAFEIGYIDFIESLFLPYINRHGLQRELMELILDPSIKVDRDALTIKSHLRKLGFNALPARTNKINDRTSVSKSFLARNILKINSSYQGVSKNEYLIRALGGEYRRKKIKGTEAFSNAIEDNETTHIVDAFQYGCLRLQNGTIVESENRHIETNKRKWVY
jgi:hypothetical protein